MRRPGIEPGSTAWKAAMLTIIPPTLPYHSNAWLSTQLVRVLNVKNKNIKNVTAVTRIRTWVTAATTQGPNH